jgi:hypothetical protein
MAERKVFLLRIDPALWAGIERLAQAEFLLHDALGRCGVISKRGKRTAKGEPGN